METLTITTAQQGEHFLVGADLTTIKVAGTATSGRMLMLEVTVPAGGGPPMLHRHEYTEIFYFLDGTFEISTAGEDYRLKTSVVKAGDVVAIPSMAWHNFKNVGASPGRFIVVHSPPVMETLVHEIGLPVADPNNLQTRDGPPSPEQMQQLMAKIGEYMEMLPPNKLVL